MDDTGPLTRGGRQTEVADLHFELRVRHLSAAKRFYVEQLSLPILQEAAAMNLLAVRVGASRMSLFASRTDDGGAGPSQIILAVHDIDESVRDLEEKGDVLSGPPLTAGTFLKFVTNLDPSTSSRKKAGNGAKPIPAPSVRPYALAFAGALA